MTYKPTYGVTHNTDGRTDGLTKKLTNPPLKSHPPYRMRAYLEIGNLHGPRRFAPASNRDGGTA